MEKLADPLAAIASSNASLLVCRICGKKGDHWTSKCPYKDLAASKGMALVRPPPHHNPFSRARDPLGTRHLESDDKKKLRGRLRRSNGAA